MKDETELPNTITLNSKAFILWAISDYFLCTVGSKDEMQKIYNRTYSQLSSSFHYHSFLGKRMISKLEKLSLYFHNFYSFLKSTVLSLEIIYYYDYPRKMSYPVLIGLSGSNEMLCYI